MPGGAYTFFYPSFTPLLINLNLSPNQKQTAHMKIDISAKQLINLTLIILFIAVPAITHAQPTFDDDVADVPIDGGLSILLAAGVGYVVKKSLKKKNNNEASDFK